MKIVSVIINSIRNNPEQWHMSDHMVFNETKRIKILVDKKVSYTTIYSIGNNVVLSTYKLSILDKIKIKRELKKLSEHLVLKSFRD